MPTTVSLTKLPLVRLRPHLGRTVHTPHKGRSTDIVSVVSQTVQELNSIIVTFSLFKKIKIFIIVLFIC